MKTLQKVFAIAILALCCGPAARMEAQAIVGPGASKLQQTEGMPWQLGGDWKFTSSSTASAGFDVRGISYYRVLWVPVGTVSACTLSLDSAAAVDPVLGTLTSPSIGGLVSAASIGSCATAGEYISSTTAGISAYGQITPTITGTGSVIVVVLGYVNKPKA
jgi:hypothetical protein